MLQHRQAHAFIEPDLVPGADVPDVLLELIAGSNENMLAIVDFSPGIVIRKRISPATEKRAFFQHDRLQAQLNQAHRGGEPGDTAANDDYGPYCH